MENANREYKDRLFRFIFGSPQNKVWTLSLYNAINGTAYTDPDAIQITTVEDALYMSMKNDLSFLIQDTMNFYEQQATVNPNMPMRFLIYAGMIYSKYIENKTNNINIYSSIQQKFPAPKLICFYNGLSSLPDRMTLQLSDAFEDGSESDIDVRVTVLNINYGNNTELMTSCEVLRDYSWFIEEIRRYQRETGNLSKAIDMALEKMNEKSLLKPFLTENKAEVRRMCITEYDEAWTMKQFKEEGRAEGREEGREEGAFEMLANLVRENLLTPSIAAKKAGMTLQEFQKKAQSLSL